MAADYIKQLKLSKENREFKVYCFELLFNSSYFQTHGRCNLEYKLQYIFKEAYNAEPAEQKKLNAAFQKANSYLRKVCEPYGFEGLLVYRERKKLEKVSNAFNKKGIGYESRVSRKKAKT